MVEGGERNRGGERERLGETEGKRETENGERKRKTKTKEGAGHGCKTLRTWLQETEDMAARH